MKKTLLVMLLMLSNLMTVHLFAENYVITSPTGSSYYVCSGNLLTMPLLPPMNNPIAYLWEISSTTDSNSTFVSFSYQEMSTFLDQRWIRLKVIEADSSISYSNKLRFYVRQSTAETEHVSACDAYTWHGTTYTSSTNLPTYHTTNIGQCPHVIHLDLTINHSSCNRLDTIVCDRYYWRGTLYTVSSDAMQIGANSSGCPDTNILHLTVNHSTTFIDVQTACDSYTWIDGNTYTTNNNTAQYTIYNSNHCDSIITLNLTVNHSTSGTDVQTACDSYTWIDGNIYTTNNNTAQYTIYNSNHCDSIITLNLTVNHSTFGTDVQTACDSYTWIDGNTYTTNNNTAQYTIYNSNHCDSIITLNLTVNHSTSGTDVQTACDSYTWIDGNTYTTNNNTAQYTIYNAHHCDSIITLNLTIHQSDTIGSISENVCDGYTWHGETYNQSGDYKYRTHTSQGCDSLCTLHLTIRHSSASSDVITECHHYTWRNGETYYTDTTGIGDTITNTENCDSIITLFLTIIQNERPPVRELVLKNLGTDSPKMVLYPRNATETDYAYQWFKDNVAIEGAKKQYYMLDGDDVGNHTFSVYVSPMEQVLCGSTSSKEVTLAGNAKSILSVSPNPNNGDFEIMLSSSEEELREVVIYSQTGNKVYESNLQENVTYIHEQLPSGVYTVFVKTNKGNTHTKKIIIK